MQKTRILRQQPDLFLEIQKQKGLICQNQLKFNPDHGQKPPNVQDSPVQIIVYSSVYPGSIFVKDSTRPILMTRFQRRTARKGPPPKDPNTSADGLMNVCRFSTYSQVKMFLKIELNIWRDNTPLATTTASIYQRRAVNRLSRQDACMPSKQKRTI